MIERERVRKKRLRSRARRRLRRLALLSVAGLVAVGVVAAVVSLWGPVRQLQEGAAGLQDANTVLGHSPSDWTPSRVAAAALLADDARPRLEQGAQAVTSNPLLNALRAVPLVGGQVAAAQDLASGSVDGSRAFDDTLSIARNYNTHQADPGPQGERLLKMLQASAAPMADASSRLGRAVPALEADLGKPLLPPLRSQVRRALDLLVPARAQADAGSIAARYAPAAIGAAGRRSYLLLLENPAELRPAGGQAGVVGTINFDHGAPAGVDVVDQLTISAKLNRHFDPPYPLSRYLVFYGNALEIGDAGWDPDFPSTARLSEAMYASATGKAVDGTISIDPYAIADILKLTGPVDVPGYGTFAAADFFAHLDHVVNVTTGPGGKKALPPIATAVLQKVLALPFNRWPQILNILGSNATSRHLQVYLHDPVLATALSRAHADGAMLAGSNDYLMVTDGNVGATKGDYYCRKSLTVRAEVPADGISRHEVVLDYDMPLPVDADDRALNPGDGTYRDYVRVWIPEASNLTDFHFTVDGKPSVLGGLDANSLAHGHRAVGVFFTLPRGHKAEVRIDYTVPLTPGSYDLYVQKQAGTPDLPTLVQVSYPGGVTEQRADLRRDGEFRVAW